MRNGVCGESRNLVILLALLLAFAVAAQTPVTVADTPTRARAADGSYISWKEHLIDDEALGGVPIRGGDGLKMADLDRDGHPDIVSVHEDSNHIRIAFGSADSDRWTLATLAKDKDAPAAEDVAIADVNGDGYPDVIAACELAHLIYFQNPVKNIRAGKWPRLVPRATIGRGSWIRVFFADFNRDGRLEVVAANKGEQLPTIDPHRQDLVRNKARNREISWFEIAGSPLRDSSWKEHVLTRVLVPINSQPVDLDRDGDEDVVGGSAGEGRIFWFENVSQKSAAVQFRQHPIEVQGRTMPQGRGHKYLGGMNMDFLDLSGDGRVDILLQESSDVVVWLEQPENFARPWRIHRLGDIAPDSSTGLALADINGDGRRDLMTGGYSQNPRDQDGADITSASTAGRLAWFEQPGDTRQRWTRHDILRRKRGMFDAFIPRDMDGDGDIDFVATRGNSGSYDGVFWLEQLRTPHPVKAFQPARAKESAHLPLPPADVRPR